MVIVAIPLELDAHMLRSNDIVGISVAAIHALSSSMRANCGSGGTANSNGVRIADRWTSDRKASAFTHALTQGPKLLSIGDDLALLRTRQMVLESAGFDVCSVSSAAIIEEPELSLVDIALICHSVERPRAAAVTRNLRKISPEISILQLYNGYVGIVSDVEQIPSDRPEDMLYEIECVLQRKHRVAGTVAPLV